MGYEELFMFAGGLGMFIYGMQIMSQGLENAAGNKMKSLLEVLTKNKFFSKYDGNCHIYYAIIA
jgi:phosphate:Na+ symporter